MTLHAPAKLNLCLYLGPRRDDGLRELCSLFEPLALADSIEVSEAERDEVVCAGVEGENLAARALAALREAGWEAPSLRIEIEKRIPVAAGLGGGSADAAAVLRAANALAGSPLSLEALRRIAAGLGSDVPSQVEPRHAVVAGVGERVEPVDLPAMALVLVPQEEGLSTPAVYRELDRLRAGDPAARAAGPDAGGATTVTEARGLDPEPLRALASGSLADLAAGLANDLEPAALSLRPELAEPLAALRSAGALAARVTGSGPTAFGVFADRAAAERAAAALPRAIVTGTRP